MNPRLLISLALPLVGTAEAALAYVGPGAGITAIGTVLALLAAAALALVGFVWYPLKRLLGLGRRRSPQDSSVAAPHEK